MADSSQVLLELLRDVRELRVLTTAIQLTAAVSVVQVAEAETEPTWEPETLPPRPVGFYRQPEVPLRVASAVEVYEDIKEETDPMLREG